MSDSIPSGAHHLPCAVCGDLLLGPGRPSASNLLTSAEAIELECDAIKVMLLEKNSRYGNSALDPLRIFSKSDLDEQINVRIDDKLSRLARGNLAGDTEDVVADLIGYLVLKRVAKRLAERT